MQGCFAIERSVTAVSTLMIWPASVGSQCSFSHGFASLMLASIPRVRHCILLPSNTSMGCTECFLDTRQNSTPLCRSRVDGCFGYPLVTMVATASRRSTQRDSALLTHYTCVWYQCCDAPAVWRRCLQGVPITPFKLSFIGPLLMESLTHASRTNIYSPLNWRQLISYNPSRVAKFSVSMRRAAKFSPSPLSRILSNNPPIQIRQPRVSSLSLSFPEQRCRAEVAVAP